MKKLIVSHAIMLIAVITLAQSPEAISYQAVIRNSSDQLVTNTQVGMQISILQGSIDGTPVYTETQSPTTNANGLISAEIGTGTTSDDFSAIDWSNSTYFVKTETDPTGGTDYTITGVSQLLSVPFALYAKDVENKDDADADPANEIQELSVDQNTISISKGNSITISNDLFQSPLFPQGINYDFVYRDTIFDLIVPADKNMYILNGEYISLRVELNGIQHQLLSLNYLNRDIAVPILPPGTLVNNIEDEAVMYFMADTISEIKPVIFELNRTKGLTYSVPANKKLVIKSISKIGSTSHLVVNEKMLYSLSEIKNKFPLILPPESEIRFIETGSKIVTGYLIDN